MKEHLFRCLPVCMLVFFSGCGGGSGGLALDQLADEMAKAFCQKAYQCCNSTEIANLESSLKFQGESGCRNYFGGWFEMYLTTPMQNAVSHQRGSYDPAKADACLKAYQALGCTGSNNASDFFDQCDNPYQGLQPAGAECANSFECQLGNYCSTNSKKCTALVGLNGACSTSGEPYCSAEFYCDAATTTCKQRKAENAPCTATSECAAGLVCHETQLTCQKPTPVCTGK